MVINDDGLPISIPFNGSAVVSDTIGAEMLTDGLAEEYEETSPTGTITINDNGVYDVFDYAYASEFEEVADIVRRASDKAYIRYLSYLNSIVSNKSVTTLNKLDSSFALTNTALAGYEHAFAVYLNEYAVTGNSWSEVEVEECDKT